MLLTMAFRNCEVEDLHFFTEKGADVSVRDTKNNSTVHFPAVAYSFDIIRLLLAKRTSVKLTDRHDENPLHILVDFGNLEKRKASFSLKSFCFEQG
jgi:ankyrin repeat protein